MLMLLCPLNLKGPIKMKCGPKVWCCYGYWINLLLHCVVIVVISLLDFFSVIFCEMHCFVAVY